jgi:ubiquinone/menaquinone biosynthesis C-methylase UbiE
VSLTTTIYTCPEHHATLTRSGSLARCSVCAKPYSIDNDIWILDSVCRTERTAFDEQVENDPVPLDLSKGERHLAEAGIEHLERASILDVGCGLGDLTYGLAISKRLKDCDIYAFDHSLASVRRAAAVTRPENGNRAHFSTQDAAALFFPEAHFDLVAGAAILHHVLDYRGLLREVFRLLRPGGKAVFSEPFLDGYFWVCFLLQCAVRDLGLKKLDAPQFGLCRSILDNTAERVRNAGNPTVLDKLTDKHFFTVEGLSTAALDLGFRGISFANYNEPRFYDHWMAHFLDIYGITDAPLRKRAIQLYAELQDYSGPALPSLVSHFKFIVLKK